MVNWQFFRSQLQAYALRDHRGTTVESFVPWFVQLYDTTMRSGGDILTRGPVLVGNISVMQSVLLAGMYSGFSQTQLGAYNWMETCGNAVKAYWTAAPLALIPGIVGLPLVNTVTNPGFFPTTNIYTAYSVDTFINVLVGNMQLHLTTLEGLIISQVGPITSPFKWIGYL